MPQQTTKPQTQSDLPEGTWTVYRARGRWVFAQLTMCEGEICQEIGGIPREDAVFYHCVGSDLRVKGVATKATLKQARGN